MLDFMQTAPTELLTTAEVARAFNVDTSTVTRWVSSGKLVPAVKTAKIFLFDPQHIAALIAGEPWAPA